MQKSHQEKELDWMMSYNISFISLIFSNQPSFDEFYKAGDKEQEMDTASFCLCVE